MCLLSSICKSSFTKYKNKSLDEINEFINICENIFENTKIILEKKWIKF